MDSRDRLGPRHPNLGFALPFFRRIKCMDFNASAFYITVIVIIAIVAIKDDAAGSRTNDTANKVIEALKAFITNITKK